MHEFLQVILSFPTVVFTVMLGVGTLYWCTVFLGLLDLDLVDVDLDGAADGALDGAVDGAAEGAADGAGDALDGADEGGVLRFLFHALGVQEVPLTFSLSMVSVWSWLFSSLGSYYLTPLLTRWISQLAAGALVFLAALFVALLISGQLVRPFARFFQIETAPHKLGLVGKLCTITTNSVDLTFGQAECKDGGAGLILQVRYAGSETPSKGMTAVLVEYDHERDVYLIEPFDPDEGLSSGTKPLTESPIPTL
ncbi:MAG: hypothetical protein R3F62_20420 [Planctomycetota bacterium]